MLWESLPSNIVLGFLEQPKVMVMEEHLFGILQNSTPREELAGGIVELPESLCSIDSKRIIKNKETHCNYLDTYLYLNHF